MDIGKTDVFERTYTQRFRALAGNYGEFVSYERDRGARDIGLHLTVRQASGAETLSPTLCWFQLKGIMASTVSASAVKSTKLVKVPLSVKHLAYWFLLPVPTYLVVYVESIDAFLVSDIQQYIERTWSTEILNAPELTRTVEVSAESILDESAFAQIARSGTQAQLRDRLGATEQGAMLVTRDFHLLSLVGSAAERGVQTRLVVRDWQTKLRSETYYEELVRGAEWERRITYLLYRGTIRDVEDMFPYLRLSALPILRPWWESGLDPQTSESSSQEDDDGGGDEDEDEDFDDDDSDDDPVLVLSSGRRVHGLEQAGEVHDFALRPRLNELGLQLHDWVKIVGSAGFLPPKPEGPAMYSIAPWHKRDV